MPIYMGIFDKPNVLNRSLRGDVTAKGYEGWIELQSVQIGTGRLSTNDTGGQGAGKPAVSEMVITKRQDAASTALFRESLHGQGRLVVIAFVKDGADYTIILRGAMVSSFSSRGAGVRAGDDSPVESLTLNFTKITYNTHDKAPDMTDAAREQWKLQQSWGP